MMDIKYEQSFDTGRTSIPKQNTITLKEETELIKLSRVEPKQKVKLSYAS